MRLISETVSMINIDIVIPVLNQLSFTKMCLDGLLRPENIGGNIVVVDNGSSDGTAEFLMTLTEVTFIRNTHNLGVAAAWNQGVMAGRAEWVILLNNDVLLPDGWIDSLIRFAIDKNMDIVSPAIREGEYNYDIVEYSRQFTEKMESVTRQGVVDGICFAVRREVFSKIGMFDEKFKIGQFEDTDFFRRALGAGFRLGTTGRSFIHHFGSITQKAFGLSCVKQTYEKENRAYFREKWQLTRWKRFWERRWIKLWDLIWSINERIRFGHSLKERWINGRLRYY